MSQQVYVDLEPVLRAVENLNSNLHAVDTHIDSVKGTVKYVDRRVRIVYSEIEKLGNEFREFADKQLKANRLGVANTKIVRIRQELEKKFGHYDTIRRHTTGILQAVDLELIRCSTISTVTEELMLDTPNYWLSPCLVAIAAWINDQPELAEKAVREALNRDDEKTSLLFALICRRADRKSSCLKWTERYMANQDEENLDRKAVIVIDAFASGLLGADSDGLVAKQINNWIEVLTEKPGFIESKITQWSDAMNLQREPLPESDYSYLQTYSENWPELKEIMEGANLSTTIFDYFEGIYKQEPSTDSLKAQLDEVLNNLVTGFDDEELPLRKEERLENYVIQFEGDEARAKSNMAIEESAFVIRKDFTQLLIDAAMKPESSGASVATQKLAIALSRDWVTEAYNDIVTKNREKIPNEIDISFESFSCKTTDGENERELVEQFNEHIDEEEATALADFVLSGFEKFCLWGGALIAGIGSVAIISSQPHLGIEFYFGLQLIQLVLGSIAIVAALVMIIFHFSKKRKVKDKRKNIVIKFDEKRVAGEEIMRAVLAEVVDFRSEFEKKDSESEKVIDFLEQLSPDQYVRKMSDSTRKIKVAQ